MGRERLPSANGKWAARRFELSVGEFLGVLSSNYRIIKGNLQYFS